MTPAVFSAGTLSRMPETTKKNVSTGGVKRSTALNSASPLREILACTMPSAMQASSGDMSTAAQSPESVKSRITTISRRL